MGTRGPVPGFSREQIVTVAVALADAEGLPAVSMRAIAGTLGTGAGSLYRYFPSRDALLDRMADAVIGEIPPFPAAADPMDALLQVARRQLTVYKRHPWLIEAIQHVQSLGPHGLAYFDHCLGALAPIQATTTAKFEAVAMITGVVAMFARPQPAGLSFAGVDLARYPNLAAAIQEAAAGAITPAPNVPDLFERTLRSLLSGLLT
ncbi:TetR/AcrR family transcriptional regulator [Dactylosporangium matsuzakiense]|uniref:TetR/AcrR family transcriptional regulator n=1 Tax=Dactylosporangium matsuzakiense TaxID=53360 RepID=UPI0021C4C7C3|nr:TetR/AcrR family transcriptional regulator [Dactylosporangium matsuzakiense]UWZ42718.1 TetR/AcrR family transcriptional regulator [Dactylosporangium matsuzakiense]